MLRVAGHTNRTKEKIEKTQNALAETRNCNSMATGGIWNGKLEICISTATGGIWNGRGLKLSKMKIFSQFVVYFLVIEN